MTHIGEARWLQYVLDECDADTALLVEAHLDSCAECRERLARERQLDEWLLASVPAACAGSAERSMERLWEAVDKIDAAATSPARPSVWGRRVALWWPAAAAAIVLALVWQLQAPFGERPRRGLDQTARPTVLQPAVESAATAVSEPRPALLDGRKPVIETVAEAKPLDRHRLHDAQQRTAEVLLAAQARNPDPHRDDDDAFGQASEQGLAALRREGWPVNSLVRGWALGEPGEVADAALRYAARQPATWNILAAALDGDQRRVESVLSQLERDLTPLEPTLALVKALERRATQDSADGRCAALLARAAGPRSSRALTRLLEARVDHAAADPGSSSAVTALLQIVALVPATPAIEALLSVAAEPGGEPSMRAAFLTRLGGARDECVVALQAALAERRPSAVLFDWIVATELPELVPTLMTRLESDPADATLLSTVVALGGAQAAAGLSSLWLAGAGMRREPLLAGLSAVLHDDPSTAEWLGSALARRGSEEARLLSEALPQEQGLPLLLACLTAHGSGPDEAGHQAAILVAVARRGRPTDGAVLLDWIDSRSADDPLLPLAWAAAAQLDDSLAGQAWGALGRDPGHLTQVAGSASRRFASSSIPSDRLLKPLRRALSADAD